jgi:hypothetical protein
MGESQGVAGDDARKAVLNPPDEPMTLFAGSSFSAIGFS